jgi:NTP pyrophosphatase (non-canonical NTP hydrolase)
MGMTLNEYQEEASSTAIYGSGVAVIYPALGLCGEAGEVAEKVKKVLRDKGGVFDDDTKLALKKEIGDVIWYLAAISRDLGFTLEEVADTNLQKLRDRKNRNVIQGSGDNR